MTYKKLANISLIVAICLCFASNAPLPVAAQDDGDALPERFLYDGLLWELEPVRGLGPGFAPGLIIGDFARPVRFHGGVPETISPVQKPVEDLRHKFIGHWKLVSWEDSDTEGNRTTRNMTGRILYDQAGNMSAHLFPTGGHEGSVTPGYLAYFGKYRIHPDFHTVIHSVEGSNIVRWIGTDLVRYYEFSDGKLILTLRRNGQVHSALTWKRLR